MAQAGFLLVFFHAHTVSCLEHLPSEGIKPIYGASETGENMRMMQLQLIKRAEVK